MSTPTVPICEACARLRPREDGPGLVCDAFPEGIPDAIYGGGFDHRKAFPGDHGIRFLLSDDREAKRLLALYESER